MRIVNQVGTYTQEDGHQKRSSSCR